MPRSAQGDVRRNVVTSAIQSGHVRDGLPRLNRYVFGVGAVVFAVLMALASRYGFHRDELYFLDAGRHLQGGYVDQPVLAPLLARVSLDLFGVSLLGLRIWPALVAWATVVVGGLIARECGGNSRAQLLAATGAATMPVLLAVDHLEGPTSVDVLAWAALALVVLRIGRTGDRRWWLVAGGILGIGLTNKHSIGIFAVAIVAGALLSGGARDVANRWFVGGAVLAAIFTVPDLVWQAGHGWATIAMTRELNSENGGLSNLPGWVVGQLLMSTLVFVPVWFAGLRALWRSPVALWRALAWAYGLLFVVYGLTTGGQIYYLAGAYVYLLAVGAIRLDAWLSGRRARAAAMLALAVISTGASVLIVLPVLPEADIGWTYGVNQAPGESIGWPGFVDQVRSAWLAIPAATRANAVIFTADYGEAGAINELGRGTGLPTAVSGDNNEWWWGPGNPNATTVLAVAPGPKDVTDYATYLQQYFAHVQDVATLRNSVGIHNQEWDGHLYLCTQPIRPWSQLWPALRHYG